MPIPQKGPTAQTLGGSGYAGVDPRFFAKQAMEQARFAQGMGFGQGQGQRSMLNEQAFNITAEAFRDQGPSMAQAQLQQSLDANTQNAQSLAAGARGGGGQAAALRQAQMQQATGGQAAAQSGALLRAQEEAAIRANQQQALQTSAGIMGGVANRDFQQQALGQQGVLEAGGQVLRADEAQLGADMENEANRLAKQQADADRAARMKAMLSGMFFDSASAVFSAGAGG